jgi:hypothetical protein
MNDDASTYEVPEYIQSRLQPQILSFEREEEMEILREPARRPADSRLRRDFPR